MDNLRYNTIFQKYPARREYLLQILHEIQNENPQNYLPEDALLEVTKYLNIPMSAVMGVVEYYSMFSTKPRGKFIIRVCKSPVCINKESDRIIESILKHYEIELRQTSTDGLICIEHSECVGRCSDGSAVSINNYYFERPKSYTILKQIEDYIKTH